MTWRNYEKVFIEFEYLAIRPQLKLQSRAGPNVANRTGPPGIYIQVVAERKQMEILSF